FATTVTGTAGVCAVSPCRRRITTPAGAASPPGQDQRPRQGLQARQPWRPTFKPARHFRAVRHTEWVVITPSDFVTIGLLVALEGLLSADNAMVLAVLVLGLPKEERRNALRYGMLGAFAFRSL